jgi:hypothetical protein
MVIAFALTAVIPRARDFFALTFADTANDLVAFAVGIAGAAALTIFVVFSGTRTNP